MSSQLHRAESLRAAGYTYEEVRKRIKDGSFTRVRRGTYLEGRGRSKLTNGTGWPYGRPRGS